MQTKVITGDAATLQKKLETLRNDGWELVKMFTTGGLIGAYLEHS